MKADTDASNEPVQASRIDRLPSLAAAIKARCKEIGVDNVEREVMDLLIKIARGEA